MRKHASELPVEDPRRVDRVRDRTPASVLAQIDRATASRVFAAARGGSDAIAKRLAELDREWDLERFVSLQATLISAVAPILSSRGRILRTMLRAQQLFLGMHAVVGWSPPVAVLRRLGVRTQKEIDAERGVLVELHRLFEEADTEGIEILEEFDEIDVVYGSPTEYTGGGARLDP